MKSLSHSDDPALSKRIRKKILSGITLGILAAYGILYGIGVIADKVFETKADITIDEYREFLISKKK